jgi:hypothetical protein
MIRIYNYHTKNTYVIKDCDSVFIEGINNSQENINEYKNIMIHMITTYYQYVNDISLKDFCIQIMNKIIMDYCISEKIEYKNDELFINKLSEMLYNYDIQELIKLYKLCEMPKNNYMIKYIIVNIFFFGFKTKLQNIVPYDIIEYNSLCESKQVLQYNDVYDKIIGILFDYVSNDIYLLDTCITDINLLTILVENVLDELKVKLMKTIIIKDCDKNKHNLSKETPLLTNQARSAKEQSETKVSLSYKNKYTIDISKKYLFLLKDIVNYIESKEEKRIISEYKHLFNIKFINSETELSV